jgi:hypothetical protein
MISSVIQEGKGKSYLKTRWKTGMPRQFEVDALFPLPINGFLLFSIVMDRVLHFGVPQFHPKQSTN